MQKGDLIEVEFTGRVKATGEIFDTTSAEEAKKAGAFSKEHKYEPVMIIVGSRMVPDGVEEALKEMKAGEEKEFDVKPEKAFGPREQRYVKILSLSKFHEKSIEPVPGIFVDIDGLQAKVRSVSGGRVVVDFNHPLAGRDLNYRMKIVREVKDPLEKAKSILSQYKIKAETNLKEGVLTLKPEKQIKQDFFKKFLADSIREWVKEIKEVVFEGDPAKALQKEAASGHEHSHEGHEHGHEGHEHTHKDGENSHEGHEHGHEGHEKGRSN